MRLSQQFVGHVGRNLPVYHLHDVAGHGAAPQLVEIVGVALAGYAEAQLEVAQRRQGVERRLESLAAHQRALVYGEDRAALGLGHR